MRQLVGLACVLCTKSIGSVVEGRFCNACGCPIHGKWVRLVAGRDHESGCRDCGAKSEDVEREKSLRRTEEQEHRAEMGTFHNRDAEWVVLLSPQARFSNPFAMRLGVDTGTLEWEAKEICVISKTIHEYSKVVSLALVSAPVPWLTMAISSIVVTAMSFGGVFSELTPTNPISWVALVSVNALLVGSSISTKWIQVTYRNKEGVEESVYLLSVSPSGWRRFDGTSHRLLALLEREVLAVSADKPAR